MTKLFHRKTFVYAVLLFWLFASVSGMHGHYCFDGMEAPVSVHFDALSGDHDDQNVGHKDVDSKPQGNALKATSIDLGFFAAVFLFSIIWPTSEGRRYSLSKTPSSWLTVIGLRPPLRAPPAHSF